MLYVCVCLSLHDIIHISCKHIYHANRLVSSLAVPPPPPPPQVLHAHCRVVADSNRGRLVPDVQALLAAFTLVGRGLVRTVELLHNTS